MSQSDATDQHRKAYTSESDTERVIVKAKVGRCYEHAVAKQQEREGTQSLRSLLR